MIKISITTPAGKTELAWPEVTEIKITFTKPKRWEMEQSKNADIQLFIDECCSLGSSFMVLSGSLYEAYKAWCLQKGIAPIYHNSFTIAVCELGNARALWRKVNKKTARWIAGLTLKHFGD